MTLKNIISKKLIMELADHGMIKTEHCKISKLNPKKYI